MSITVKDELEKIGSFSETTEKRRSGLTLNELNYISDKQLHQKTSEPVEAHTCLIYEYTRTQSSNMDGSLVQNTVGDFDAIAAAASAGTLEVYLKQINSSNEYLGSERVGQSWSMHSSGDYIMGSVVINNGIGDIDLRANINKSDLTLTLTTTE